MIGSAEHDLLIVKGCRASFCNLDLNLLTEILTRVKYLVNVLNFTTIDLSHIIKIAHLISAYKIKESMLVRCFYYTFVRFDFKL